MRITNPYTPFGSEQPLSKVTRYEYFLSYVSLWSVIVFESRQLLSQEMTAWGCCSRLRI